jgi:signal transduction histidine kinase
MPHAALQAQTLTADACLTGMRPSILLVDDHTENLLLTEQTLKSLGAMIFKATSGKEALLLMQRHRFALVLLDVRMPQMDGFQTARHMKATDAMNAIPIIFFTARGEEEKLAEEAAEIGAMDYIFKPIHADILKSKISVYLDLYVQREQILQLNSYLRQSNEELERFAYICSHDMQEPVRMMNSYAQLLGKKYVGMLDEKGRKYLEFISSNASHMQKMIHDILVFCRVGREDTEYVELDSAALLQDVIREFEDTIADMQARITVEQLPRLFTSPTLLRMLFHNLICNALKFQPKGRIPDIHISASRRESEWQFCVQDNGIGIPRDSNTKVFSIFQRLHRREEYPGTGIGLSTCKKFIELYGGTIWFESSDVGACFHFTLPIQHGGL